MESPQHVVESSVGSNTIGLVRCEPLVRDTQWEVDASFSLSTRGPEFCSGTAPTPVSLLNWFTVLDESVQDQKSTS